MNPTQKQFSLNRATSKKQFPISCCTILLVLSAAAGFGQAASATLKVGDPAPKLQVSKWVQGEPVKEFARDKVYIVEFWATWCGPCRVSIPHLNELHTKFKDKGLVVIGQNVWERDQEVVAPFIQKMGSEMTYRVGLDTLEGEQGKMAQTWMEAAGQDGIPAAFVVDKRGIIAWIGHPMHLNEELLQQVLDAKFDLAQAAADYEARQKADVKQRTLSEEFRRQKQKGEWDAAEATLAEIEKLLPEAERDDLGVTRFELLLDRKDYQGAYKLAARLSDAHPENAMMQKKLRGRSPPGKVSPTATSNSRRKSSGERIMRPRRATLEFSTHWPACYSSRATSTQPLICKDRP